MRPNAVTGRFTANRFATDLATWCRRAALKPILTTLVKQKPTSSWAAVNDSPQKTFRPENGHRFERYATMQDKAQALLTGR
jgi:hypothetical protein